MTVISVKNVWKTFNDESWVLEDVSLDIKKGSFVSVTGASGSGKSTLLTIIGGMDRPTKGEVFFKERDITKFSEKELAKLRRTDMGFVFQFFNLAPYLTVEENIMLPIILNGDKESEKRERLEYLLDYLGIAEYRKKMPAKLSGGEQQRVAIARGLIFQPELILLDEPTGNLDSKSSQSIMELLKKINIELGTTIVQVTHSEKNAAYGDRIIHISDGKIHDERIISSGFVTDEASFEEKEQEKTSLDIASQAVEDAPKEDMAEEGTEMTEKAEGGETDL